MDESWEVREGSMGGLAFGVSEAGRDWVWWAGGGFGPLVPRRRRWEVAAGARGWAGAARLAVLEGVVSGVSCGGTGLAIGCRGRWSRDGIRGDDAVSSEGGV